MKTARKLFRLFPATFSSSLARLKSGFPPSHWGTKGGLGEVLILFVALSAFASEPMLAPVGENPAAPRTNEFQPPPLAPADSPWDAAVDVIGKVGSSSVLAVALAPQGVADATSAGVHAVKLPSRVVGMCTYAAGIAGTLGKATTWCVKETIHWIALPLYLLQSALEQLPAPRMPWEKKRVVDTDRGSTRDQVGLIGAR